MDHESGTPRAPDDAPSNGDGLPTTGSPSAPRDPSELAREDLPAPSDAARSDDEPRTGDAPRGPDDAAEDLSVSAGVGAAHDDAPGPGDASPSRASTEAPAAAGAAPRSDPRDVEEALALALERASRAERWDVVALLARELEARRMARAGNVVAIGARRPKPIG